MSDLTKHWTVCHTDYCNVREGAKQHQLSLSKANFPCNDAVLQSHALCYKLSRYTRFAVTLLVTGIS